MLEETAPTDVGIFGQPCQAFKTASSVVNVRHWRLRSG